MTITRKLAVGYAILVLAVIGWAWWTDVAMLGSRSEHLAPDMWLILVSMPFSLSAGLVFETWPDVFARPLMPLAWLSVCGLAQIAVALFIAWCIDRIRSSTA